MYHHDSNKYYTYPKCMDYYSAPEALFGIRSHCSIADYHDFIANPIIFGVLLKAPGPEVKWISENLSFHFIKSTFLVFVAVEKSLQMLPKGTLKDQNQKANKNNPILKKNVSQFQDFGGLIH